MRIFNTTKYRSDALIVLGTGPRRLVPLPATTPTEVQDMSFELMAGKQPRQSIGNRYAAARDMGDDLRARRRRSRNHPPSPLLDLVYTTGFHLLAVKMRPKPRGRRG